jgi:hypothetical protein
MVKNYPNQIVNLQNNFFLSRNLFFLFLKIFLPIKALTYQCANPFAQVSSENSFVFLLKKAKLFTPDLRLSEQKIPTNFSNLKNLDNFLCKYSIRLFSQLIKNYDKKIVFTYSYETDLII